MELTLGMNSSMDHMEFVWLLVVSKPRVLLGFHPNPKIMEIRVGKTLNGTR